MSRSRGLGRGRGDQVVRVDGRMRGLAGLVVAAGLVLSGPAARGEDAAVIKTMTAGQIERIVQAFKEVENFEEVGNNSYGFSVNGLKMVLFNKNETMQLYAGFEGTATLSRINEWNRTRRFTRAYLDSDNDPVLESDLDLTGGVTEENVDEWIRTFVLSLTTFQKHISE